jgi:glycosyltransferase involved in cell wall biosynthesis
VPNGVAQVPARSTSTARDPHLIAAVGRLERMKGFDLLIAAFARAGLPSTARLLIGGDGAARWHLQSQIDELALTERVTLLGRLESAQVAELMGNAGIVVVPSRREAFGIVVLEAWRAGAAVIATSRGGPADLVTDGVTGLVRDPEDIDGLAEALGKLVADPARAAALGQAGRRAVTEYTWEKTAAAYEQIYADVLREPASKDSP